jgi:hypothetical protein
LYRLYAVNVDNTDPHKGGMISGENVNLRSNNVLNNNTLSARGQLQLDSRNGSGRISPIGSTLTPGMRGVFNAGRDMSVLASHITACDTRSSLNPP